MHSRVQGIKWILVTEAGASEIVWIYSQPKPGGTQQLNFVVDILLISLVNNWEI